MEIVSKPHYSKEVSGENALNDKFAKGCKGKKVQETGGRQKK